MTQMVIERGGRICIYKPRVSEPSLLSWTTEAGGRVSVQGKLVKAFL